MLSYLGGHFFGNETKRLVYHIVRKNIQNLITLRGIPRKTLEKKKKKTQTRSQVKSPPRKPDRGRDARNYYRRKCSNMIEMCAENLSTSRRNNSLGRTEVACVRYEFRICDIK